MSATSRVVVSGRVDLVRSALELLAWSIRPSPRLSAAWLLSAWA